MKVRVSIKNLCKVEVAASALDVIVGPEDTVLMLKERVAVAAPVPLSEQELLLNDTVLTDAQRLADCGVKDKDALVLRFKATEQHFNKQLIDMMKGKAVSPDELALVYTHYHGITIREALDSLNCTGEKLQDFLGRQKCFKIIAGLARAVEPDAKPAEVKPTQVKPAATAIACKEEVALRSVVLLKVAVSIVLRVAGRQDEEYDELDMSVNELSTVAEFKARVAQQALVPFPDRDLVLQGEVLRDQARLVECAVKNGACLVFLVRPSEEALSHQLKDILAVRTALSPDQLGLQYCVKHGVPFNQAARMLGLRDTPRSFLERQKGFLIDGGCVRLHGKNRDQRFGRVVGFLSEATGFLNVHSITEGGLTAEEPEAVLALNGLPPASQAAWLPGLLRSVAAGLEANLDSDAAQKGGIVGVHVTEDFVQVLLEGGAVMNTRLVAA